MPKKNIAVIFGGRSGEHEVSLSSAMGVMNNLDKEKYNIIPVAITKNGNWLTGENGNKYLELNSQFAGKENAISMDQSQSLVNLDKDEASLAEFTQSKIQNEKIDFVLPILHGPFGEDGKIQGFFDTFNIPYAFSGVLAHALAMNKPKAKIIVANEGVPVVKGVKIKKDNYNINSLIDDLDLPIIIKPAELGSSVGVTLAKTKEELEKGVNDAFVLSEEVLLEQFIKSREFTVAVLGNNPAKALAVIEIIPLISEFYDYKAKYEEGGSKHVCPAEISDDLKSKMQEYAVIAYNAIGCKDLARVDFLYDEDKDKLYFMEVNTIPGMTPTSLVPEAAKEEGIEFGELLDIIIEKK